MVSVKRSPNIDAVIPWYLFSFVDRVSVVGIATRNGLDGPGIESRWGARFSALTRTGAGAHPTSCNMGTGFFPGVNRPGRGNHPPLLVPMLKGVELYLVSLSGPSWPALG